MFCRRTALRYNSRILFEFLSPVHVHFKEGYNQSPSGERSDGMT
jgi:hypothetical protein